MQNPIHTINGETAANGSLTQSGHEQAKANRAAHPRAAIAVALSGRGVDADARKVELCGDTSLAMIEVLPHLRFRHNSDARRKFSYGCPGKFTHRRP